MDGLDVLIAATSSTSVPPSSNSSMPVPVHATLIPAKRTLSDITNTMTAPSSKRRHQTRIGQKIKLVAQVQEKITAGISMKQAVASAGIRDKQTFLRYKEISDTRDAAPKKQRLAKTRMRQAGGGRHPLMSADEDKQLKDWLMGLRRGEKRERVSIKHLREEARRMITSQQENSSNNNQRKFKASNKWAQAWMKRQGLSLRLRTTGKEVTTAEMQAKAADYRVQVQPIFTQYTDIKIWNMDETSIYLDAPGNRTIDEIGAHTVEIGTTKHEKDRLTAVLCVSSTGDRMKTLIIHKSKAKSKQNKIEKVDVKYHGTQTVEMYIGYNKKAYMNSHIMCEWIKEVYAPQASVNNHVSSDGFSSVLFLDNVKIHTCPSVINLLTQHKVKYEFFPPNCTPLVQPLDHSLNASTKHFYEEEWRLWFHSALSDQKTRKGNRKKATNSTINQWVAAADEASQTPLHIVKCWYHTLNVQSLLLLAAALTQRQQAETQAAATAEGGTTVAVPAVRSVQ
jgi:hypothetical protein